MVRFLMAQACGRSERARRRLRPNGRPGRALGLALILCALLAALPVGAQNPVALEALTIELWPEYDQPSMLTILRATLAPSTALPASITLHIPAAAKGPSAVAVQDAAGQQVDAPYTTSLQGDSIAVQVQVPFANFQVEYYDPGLTITGQARDFQLEWIADYAVKTATLQIQQPVDARDLKAEPAVSLAGSSNLGLNYYTGALGPLSAGQTVSLHLSYAKATATLTKQTVDPISAAPTLVRGAPVPPASTPGRPVSLPSLLIGGAGLLGLSVVVWGGRQLARRRRPGVRVRAWPRLWPLAANHRPMPPAPEAGSLARFCTQCGHRRTDGDRFCRGCGTPLRAATVIEETR